MTSTTSLDPTLNRLKEILQMLDPAAFEKVAAALFSRLLDVPVAVARSGFQFGGDGGTSGRQGRWLRIECKRYADDTRLNERELRGEFAQANQHDPALEAWILVATRPVPEQLEHGLTVDGAAAGVPVLIVDWKPGGMPALAALCSCAPEVLGQFVSAEAETLARGLEAAAATARSYLRREVEAWSIGFEALRAASLARLEEIWTSRTASSAYFAQDAAGGAVEKRVRRTTPFAAMEGWWSSPLHPDTPLVVLGFDGVGKTWATLDWLNERRGDLPICLPIPSSAAAGLGSVTEIGVKRFIADRLYELGRVRDVDHWMRRLERLLTRPDGEGPVLLLFFDGMNQEESLKWRDLLRMLQGPSFAGKVRVIASTRKLHFDKLSQLRGMPVPHAPVKVDLYDLEPGGELDTMLRFEGLKRSSLHPELLEMARNPRLFDLVVRFGDKLVEAGQVTVHRLLWEYGRDTLGGRSFNEDEWRAWLAAVARRLRDGIRDFSMKELADSADRADLEPKEVSARLSDIIDGRFTTPGPDGRLVLAPIVVAHALGAALAAHLSEDSRAGREAVENALTKWLDPIAGYDTPAEILRAAVSIMIEEGRAEDDPVLSVALTAWLQTQNLPDLHREEVVRLAPPLATALLDAVERSRLRSQRSARRCAVQALRSISSSDEVAWGRVIAGMTPWFDRVPLGIDDFARESEDYRRHKAERLIARIGVDRSGPMRLLGLHLDLVDLDDDGLQGTAIEILDGRPLRQAGPIFERAAVAAAAAGWPTCWDALKWICCLNEADPQRTAEVLRRLSMEMRTRTPEPGVNRALPHRAAALLLWLTGFEEDDIEANRLDPGIDRPFTYENDYLPHPARSFFALERRHAAEALLDRTVGLRQRIQRVGQLWFDPTFEPPAEFTAELVAAMIEFDVTGRHKVGMTTAEDSTFEEVEVALARCAPSLLASLQRRTAEALGKRPKDSRYWAAINAHEAHLLLGDSIRAQARRLRLSGTEDHATEEAYAANKLLFLELAGQGIREQLQALIDADLRFILHDFEWLEGQPSAEDWQFLLGRYGAGTDRERHNLLIVLLMKGAALTEPVWTWVQRVAADVDHDDRHVAFAVLAKADEARFGRWLREIGWHWSADQQYWINHHGSGALLASGTNLPFEQMTPFIAPWRLLEAVRRRGGDPTEAATAAGIFGAVLSAEGRGTVDLASEVTMDRTDPNTHPFNFSAEPRDAREDGSPIDALRRAFDLEGLRRASREAQETAHARVKAARAAGADLYLANVAAADFDPILQANVSIDLWLEGFEEVSTDFQRRVGLAELAYVALCEALLRHDPARGVVLWRALRRTLATNFIGRAAVDEMLLLLFRVPDSPAVDALRLEQLELEACHNDLALFELCLAATLAGRDAWVCARIADDEPAASGWRRRRAIRLSAFLAHNQLPVDGAWQTGEPASGYDGERRLAARSRALEAASHHWWTVFGSDSDPERAYAAWILFSKSADRRAHAWLSPGLDPNADPISRAKATHAQLNWSGLKRALKKMPDKGEQKFLDRNITEGIGPWRRA